MSWIWRRADSLWRDPRRARNLMWTEQISYRLGSIIAAILERTPVTPNQVTLVGLVITMVGAAYLALLEPSSVVASVPVILAWQVGYSLDCADGQLARATGRQSDMGAWFDQLADFVAHTFVFGAVLLHLSRSISLDTRTAVILTTFVVSAQLLHGFSAALRTLLVGRGGNVTGVAQRSPVFLLAHLTDYGFVAFLASVLVSWPTGLLIAVVSLSMLNLAMVAAQIVVSWRRPRSA